MMGKTSMWRSVSYTGEHTAWGVTLGINLKGITGLDDGRRVVVGKFSYVYYRTLNLKARAAGLKKRLTESAEVLPFS